MGLMMRSIPAQEVDAVQEVYYRCNDTLALGPEADLSLTKIKGRLRRPDGDRRLKGIYANEELIGLAEFDVQAAPGEPGKADLSMLMLASARRFDGVGTEAVRLLEAEILKTAPVRVIGSAVEITNPTAFGFWVRMGYEIVGGPDWRPDQVGLFYLRKTLGPSRCFGFLNPENKTQMGKVEQYRKTLRSLEDWDSYLLANSGLPGPRANLELAQAAAAEGTEELFSRYRLAGPDRASTNSAEVFLVVCGVIGLGRLMAEGHLAYLPVLRALASDPRWRVREAVCMALQWWGDADMDGLLAEMKDWALGRQEQPVPGSLLEMRAAAAAVCEPRLLAEEKHARLVLDLLDGITAALLEAPDRSAEDFRVLRQALAYCWSVAAAASFEDGRLRLERWFACKDRAVASIMRENLTKKRLIKKDPSWAENWKHQLSKI